MKTAIQFTYILGDDNELDVTANVTPGCPARTNCLPEDAYPAEDAEVEIVSVKFGDKDFAIEGVITQAYMNTATRLVYRQSLEDALEEAAIEALREQGA
jgi:hypothetical protein